MTWRFLYNNREHHMFITRKSRYYRASFYRSVSRGFTNKQIPKPLFVTFGEAMIRYAPAARTGSAAEMYGYGKNSGLANFHRSVGGDEMNVAIALQKLGNRTKWISAVPKGFLGEYVRDVAKHAGVDVQDVKLVPNSKMGIYHLIPDEARVEYDRKDSAFAKQEKGQFKDTWDKIAQDTKWLHMTGITPMCSQSAKENWFNIMSTYQQQSGACISLDFNHRPALGTVEELWHFFEPVFSGGVEILILCNRTLPQICKLSGTVEKIPEEPLTTEDLNDLAKGLGKILNVRVAWCTKEEEEKGGYQRRYSSIYDPKLDEIITTKEWALIHSPREPTGGGSAWAAGFIDYFMNFEERKEAAVIESADTQSIEQEPDAEQAENVAADKNNDPDDQELRQKLMGAITQADMLAALAQETFGDHSTATRILLDDFLTKSKHSKEKLGKPFKITEAKFTSFAEPQQPIYTTIAQLKAAGTLAILRTERTEATYERGMELYRLGCRAMEVTCDSKGWQEIIRRLVESIGDDCVIGVGTVYTKSELAEAAACGARFALSPINPGSEFMLACESFGILAVPAASTAQEIYEANQQGAPVIKLFPAQQWTPTMLRQFRAIGSFHQLKLLPSGGITPENAKDWLNAGAFCVGLGSNLCGGDLRDEHAKILEEARHRFKRAGAERARMLFTMTSHHPEAITSRHKAWNTSDSGVCVGPLAGEAQQIMPKVGYGLYQIAAEDTQMLTEEAVKAGYRHLDCASFYKNEAEVGKALQALGITSKPEKKEKKEKEEDEKEDEEKKQIDEAETAEPPIVQREDLFITSKVWMTEYGFSGVHDSVRRTLDELGLEYLDNFCVHWPAAKHIETYNACEQLLEQGKIRSIGISNYTPDDYNELLPHISTPPVSNQIEVNPFCYRPETIRYFHEKNIQIVAYKPFGRGAALQHSTVLKIANELEVSPSAVLLRWAINKNLVVLPRSSNKERLTSNLLEWQNVVLSEAQTNELDVCTTESALLKVYSHYEDRKLNRDGKFW